MPLGAGGRIWHGKCGVPHSRFPIQDFRFKIPDPNPRFKFPKANANPDLFVPQSDDGVKAGGFDGGPHSKEQADADGGGKAHDHRPEGNP